MQELQGSVSKDNDLGMFGQKSHMSVDSEEPELLEKNTRVHTQDTALLDNFQILGLKR